jgi:4-amino-4-deoxy-L-arabinose transferase-like glycosyltransferase
VLANRLRQSGIVVAITAFVMLTNLGGPRLWDRDEPRNAGCAREMLQRGDWVVPTFNAELRTHKPVLLYWGIMASYLAFGVNEFAARLPSALAAIGTTFCVYLMGRRLFGPRAGVWAGIALATSLMFVVAGRAATPDSLLIFCSTLALTIFVCGTFRPRFETTPEDAPPEPKWPLGQAAGHFFPQHWPAVLAMYAAMGLAVLAKGPVGLLLPAAVIGLFLLIARLPRRNATEGVPYSANGTEGVPYCVNGTERVSYSRFSFLAALEPLHFLRTCWSMRPFTAIFATLAVALPWYAAVGLATDGEFVRGFFLEHNLTRATSVMEGHRGSLLYYPVAILAGCFPWSVFALPLAIDTVLQLRRRDRFHAGYLLAVCWIAVYVGLFSLARTKLPSYVTPCYPAIALLVGDYIDRWSRHSAAVAGRWLLAAFGCLALAGIAITIAVPLAAKQFAPGEEWLGLIGLTPLAGGAACLGLAAAKNLRAAAGVFGAAAVTLATLLFGVGAHRIDQHQTSQVVLSAIRNNSHQPSVASYRILEPSWVYYLGQPIVELRSLPRGNVKQHLATFLRESPETFVITTRSRLVETVDLIPPDVTVLAETRLFLRQDNLVLLGRPRPPDAAKSAHGPKSIRANALR